MLNVTLIAVLGNIWGWETQQAVLYVHGKPTSHTTEADTVSQDEKSKIK